MHFDREYFFVNGLLHKKPCGKSVDAEVVEPTKVPCEKSVDLEDTEQTKFF